MGALCFIPADTIVENRKVIVGNPAKVVKDVTDEMINWKSQGTKIYQQLAKDCNTSLKPVEPLREIPADRKVQQKDFKTWNETK